MKITCGSCTSTWTGLSYAHCSVCHRTFANVTGFDRHRRDGRCLDPTSFGYLELNKVWATPEGHANVARKVENLKAAQS